VVNGLLKPDFFLVGESDKRSGDLLESIYRRLQVVADNDKKQAIPIARMSIANAELTKISVNAFVTAKISFANTLCRICDAMPDGDSHVVAKAVGMDQRIGGRYLAPGATYGGPCFPRDNRAFEWFARSVGADAPLARATDEVNRQQVDFLVRLIVAKAPTGTTVGLLGLSYKPHTNLMEESLAVELAERLIGRGYRVVAYDPWVAKHGVTETVPGLQILVSMELCMRESRVLVLCTAHEEFLNLKRADLGDGVMVDIWGALRRRGWTVDRRYVVPGVSESTAVSG
jgi:UDPglucose 6-dehydrogenase